MKRLLMLFLMMGLATTLLFGCSGEEEPEVVDVEVPIVEEVEVEPEPEPQPEPEPEPQPELELQVIGTEEEGAYEVLLTNNTGYDIVGFSIRTNLEYDFDGNLLLAGEVFPAGETAILFYLPADDEQAEDIPFEINVEYLVRIVLEDDREFILNSFPIDDAHEEIILSIYEDVAFVEFESISLGELVSTLTREQVLAEAELWTESAPVYIPVYTPAYTPAYTPVYIPVYIPTYTPAAPPAYVAAPPPPPVQEVEICLPDDVIINEWDD